MENRIAAAGPVVDIDVGIVDRHLRIIIGPGARAEPQRGAQKQQTADALKAAAVQYKADIPKG